MRAGGADRYYLVIIERPTDTVAPLMFGRSAPEDDSAGPKRHRSAVTYAPPHSYAHYAVSGISAHARATGCRPVRRAPDPAGGGVYLRRLEDGPADACREFFRVQALLDSEDGQQPAADTPRRQGESVRRTRSCAIRGEQLGQPVAKTPPGGPEGVRSMTPR